MAAFLFAGLNRCFKVAEIIKRIKNTNNINTICNGFLNKILNHIICVMTITKNILTSEQHLKLCMLKSVS